MKIDINKLFDDMEKRLIKNKEIDEIQKDDIVENEVSKESEEEAKNPEIIAEEQNNISEDIHGGEEDAQEVKDSKTNKSDEDKEDKEDKDNNDDKEDKKNNNDDKDDKKDKKDKKDSQEVKDSKINKSEKDKENKIDNESIKLINNMYEEKYKKFKDLTLEEQLNKEMLDIIKNIAKKHSGTQKVKGEKLYDVKAIAKHILTGEIHKISNDKYDRIDSREVQFFIDTSGSNISAFNGLIEVIQLLNRQGFDCMVADCGNGFVENDMDDDEYGAKRKMELFKGAKVSKIVRPCPETAAKMSETAEFSIILADFDGLSSICKMESLCSKEKKPYLLSTEYRYSWDNPTEHDWVDPDWCYYPKDRIYDIGNQIELINEKECENYEYDER